MANVKVTQDKNGVRWLELMRSGSGTLLEIRNKEEALQIINALQQSVQSDACRECGNRTFKPAITDPKIEVCVACGTRR